MDPAAAGITPLLLDPLPFYQSLLYHTIQLRFAIDGGCLSAEIKIIAGNPCGKRFVFISKAPKYH